MNLDDKIKETLHKRTLSQSEKDALWEKIEYNMNQINKKKKPKKKPFVWVASAASLCFAIALSSQTQWGQASFSSVKNLFMPEKQVEISIEGNTEETNSVLVTDESTDYILYIDEEHYTSFVENNVTRITPKIPLDDRYPEVSMIISEESSISQEDIIKRLTNEFNDAATFRVEEVTQPLQATSVTIILGTEWDSKVKRYYVFSNQKNGSFIIEQNFFLEAMEGHGARMDAMLKEFKIVQ